MFLGYYDFKLFSIIVSARDGGYRTAETQARDLTRNIRREVTKLSETWVTLLTRSDNWQLRLEESVSVSDEYILITLLYIYLLKTWNAN